MAHPISPIQYRAGKTFAWRSNVVIASPTSRAIIGPGDQNLASGVEVVMKHLLKNYRVFCVRSTLKQSEKIGSVELRVLYAPRIKVKDRSPNLIGERAAIIDRTLQNEQALPEDLLLRYFMYLYKVVDEEHEMEIETESPWYFEETWPLLEEDDEVDFRWRFFRGSRARRFLTKGSRNRNYSRRQGLFYKSSLRSPLLSAWRGEEQTTEELFILRKLSRRSRVRGAGRGLKKLRRAKISQKPRGVRKGSLLSPLVRAKSLESRLYFRGSRSMREKFSAKLKSYQRLRSVYARRRRWYVARKAKSNNEVLARPSLNSLLISKEVSMMLHKNVRVKLKNVFTYLVQKRRLNRRHWAKHLWHRGYRSRIKDYSNYFDILNGFYLVCKINFTEHHLMHVIMLPFPRFETKFKPYIYFLDSVLRHMWRLKKKYGVIRLTVTGKLAGGRKRTKVKTVGFGKFPKNSYSVEILHQFAKFTHRFGEFGVKLLMGMKRAVRYNKKKLKNGQRKRKKKVKETRLRAGGKRKLSWAERNKITNPLIASLLGVPDDGSTNPHQGTTTNKAPVIKTADTKKRGAPRHRKTTVRGR